MAVHAVLRRCFLNSIVLRGAAEESQTFNGSLQFPPRVRAEGEGVLRYQGDGQLTGLGYRREASGANS